MIRKSILLMPTSQLVEIEANLAAWASSTGQNKRVETLLVNVGGNKTQENQTKLRAVLNDLRAEVFTHEEGSNYRIESRAMRGAAPTQIISGHDRVELS